MATHWRSYPDAGGLVSSETGPATSRHQGSASPDAARKPTDRNGRTMAVVTMKQLLASGTHFGHQTRRWNPKMKRFIFTDRNGIYIIDLQQTLTYIDKAYEFVKETVAHGGSIMFVGTKKQAQESIAEEATRVGMPYVNQRWLGGMLTNFSTVHKRLQRLKELEAMEQTGGFEGRTKKEILMLTREKNKLERSVGGLGRRHQQGAHRRRRGSQTRYPGHRDPGHQLRSGPGRLPDPGQRRRDPVGRAAHQGGRVRRRRGSAGPRQRGPRRRQGRGRGRRAAGRMGAGAACRCHCQRTARHPGGGHSNRTQDHGRLRWRTTPLPTSSDFGS